MLRLWDRKRARLDLTVITEEERPRRTRHRSPETIKPDSMFEKNKKWAAEREETIKRMQVKYQTK